MSVLSMPQRILIQAIPNPMERRHPPIYAERAFREATRVPVIGATEPVPALEIASFDLLRPAGNIVIWGEMPQGKCLRGVGEFSTILSDLATRQATGKEDLLGENVLNVFYVLIGTLILAFFAFTKDGSRTWHVDARTPVQLDGVGEVWGKGTRAFSRVYPPPKKK